MEEIKITVTEDKIIFGTLGYLPLFEFLKIIRNNGVDVLAEAQALRARFDVLKTFDAAIRIDLLMEQGFSMQAIAEKVKCSSAVLEEFLSIQSGFMNTVRENPSYGPACDRLRADKSLI